MTLPGLLQIVRILYRFLIRVFDQSRIAAERICNDLFFFFHNLTSPVSVSFQQ